MIKVVLTLALAAFTLTSCAGGPRTMPRERIDRALAMAPGKAQPTKIVATELAFARMAREEGQWTAFRAFAAPGALIHGREGPIVADLWLAKQDDPDEAVKWSPKTVWMSCDAELAVSRGRFRQPEGKVGTFITVWQRSRDEKYSWAYDIGVLDDPQPAKTEAIGEDDIVVTGLDAIRGHVADCPARGDVTEPLPTPLIGKTGGQSPDGSLKWSWQHQSDGSRSFSAAYFFEGEWRTVIDKKFDAAASAEPNE